MSVEHRVYEALKNVIQFDIYRGHVRFFTITYQAWPHPRDTGYLSSKRDADNRGLELRRFVTGIPLSVSIAS
jgi:hypothetical protein